MGAAAALAARERGKTMVTLEEAEVVARLRGRLWRIANAHIKYVDRHGGTDGTCVECVLTWPCPTYAWATNDRDPLLDAWVPADDGN